MSYLDVISSEAKFGFDKEKFVYVESIKLEVSEKKFFFEKSWEKSHKLIHGSKGKMLTPFEYLKFLKFLKESGNEEYLKLYKEITGVECSNRGEWIDARAEFGSDNLFHLRYNHEYHEGKLIAHNSELLDKNTLIEDKMISLDYLIENHSENGLPARDCLEGNLSYMAPIKGPSAGIFYANEYGILFGFCSPYLHFPSIGARIAREKKKN